MGESETCVNLFLQGIAVGNGLVDPYWQRAAYPQQAYANSFIGTYQRQQGDFSKNIFNLPESTYNPNTTSLHQRTQLHYVAKGICCWDTPRMLLDCIHVIRFLDLSTKLQGHSTIMTLDPGTIHSIPP